MAQVLDEHTVEIDATIDVPAEKVHEEYTSKNAKKEEKREKRKTKIPKSVKKRAMKQEKMKKWSVCWIGVVC